MHDINLMQALTVYLTVQSFCDDHDFFPFYLFIFISLSVQAGLVLTFMFALWACSTKKCR